VAPARNDPPMPTRRAEIDEAAPTGKHREAFRPVRIEQGASDKIIGNLLTTEGDIAAEYRRRNDPYIYQSVHPADVEALIAEGWEEFKKREKKAGSVKAAKIA